MASTTFDTLQAARDLESAGVKRTEAEAMALAIHKGQGDLATKGDISALRWIVGIQSAITLATFAAVPWLAARLL